MSFIKSVIKKFLNFFGFELVGLKSFHQDIRIHKKCQSEKAETEICLNKILFMLSKSTTIDENNFSIEGFINFCSHKVLKSKSQIFQDLFILYFFNEKKNGFFVEFGATNGVDLSNTFLLEKNYEWEGIVAEPGRIWESELKKNRNCYIDTRCVWTTSGNTMKFNETTVAELSSLHLFSNEDFLSTQRIQHATYDVTTVSLNDLLLNYKAPFEIDYLSIDTEGSELEILQAFDFEKYCIKVITVEHNFTLKRQQIFELLSEKGYQRVFSKISLFDDWYIKNNFLQKTFF